MLAAQRFSDFVALLYPLAGVPQTWSTYELACHLVQEAVSRADLCVFPV